MPPEAAAVQAAEQEAQEAANQAALEAQMAAAQLAAPGPEAAYESEIEPEYRLEAQMAQNGPKKVAISNPNFVDPGMETENEYNKTHEITRDEVHTKYLQKDPFSLFLSMNVKAIKHVSLKQLFFQLVRRSFIFCSFWLFL